MHVQILHFMRITISSKQIWIGDWAGQGSDSDFKYLNASSQGRGLHKKRKISALVMLWFSFLSKIQSTWWRCFGVKIIQFPVEFIRAKYGACIIQIKSGVLSDLSCPLVSCQSSSEERPRLSPLNAATGHGSCFLTLITTHCHCPPVDMETQNAIYRSNYQQNVFRSVKFGFKSFQFQPFHNLFSCLILPRTVCVLTLSYTLGRYHCKLSP